MGTESGAHLPVVNGTVTGEDIKRRRIAAGLDQAELAREAGVGRTTLHNIEAGAGARGSSLGKIIRALEAAEAESGVVRTVPSEPPEVEMIEFEIEGAFGVKVVRARGPRDDHDILREDVIAIIRSIQQGESEPDESSDLEG